MKKLGTRALKPLNFLLGTWRTSGKEANGSSTVNGTDMYEPATGGAFILHTVDVRMGRKKVQVVELIGHDPTTETFVMRSFDNEGNFITMHGRSPGKGVLRITGDGIRAELKAMSKSKMVARWERSEDGWK